MPRRVLCPHPCSRWVVRCSVLVPVLLLRVFCWCDLGKGRGGGGVGGDADGLGTAAGGRDAASESRAATELISPRLPPSP